MILKYKTLFFNALTAVLKLVVSVGYCGSYYIVRQPTSVVSPKTKFHFQKDITVKANNDHAYFYLTFYNYISVLVFISTVSNWHSYISRTVSWIGNPPEFRLRKNDRCSRSTSHIPWFVMCTFGRNIETMCSDTCLQ